MPDDTAPPSTCEQSTVDPGMPSSDGSFGRYRLLQRLGEGGMGEVWLAEQAEPVHRQVAVKVIKAGMDSVQVIARFEAERQALPAGHWLIAASESALGACLVAGRRFREAEALLLHGYEGLRVSRGDTHERTVEARLRLVALYEAWGRPDRAAAFRTLGP